LDYLRVKNWDTFQHYKDRNPPWIKMHRGLLDDYEFGRLQDASKAHLMMIWLFASQNGGRVPADPRFLQAKLSLDKQPDLNVLVEQGFLIPEQTASPPLSERKQDASTVIAFARSREERREETDSLLANFARFWKAYPRRIAKPAALKAFKSLSPDGVLLEKMLVALERQRGAWSEEKFIPYPQKWINQRRWEDEAAPDKPLTVAL
jgi:hypothetical protein